MELLRKCIILNDFLGLKGETCLFHKFGSYSDSDGETTMAIVEAPNGKVYVVYPSEIQFVKD